MKNTIDRSQRNLGPIWLSPGVTPKNVIALFLSGMMTMIFVTTQGLLFPYLLHEHIQMPTELQGDFTGNLTVLAEIVVIAVIVPVSVLSDRIGRRPIYVAGFTLLAASLVLTPFARDAATLVAVRLLSSAAMAACLMMLASVIADYPQNASRGKLISVNGVFTGLGVVLIASLVFSQLPEIFAARGLEPIEAGTFTFLLIAGTAAAAALIAWLGLRGGRAHSHRERPPFRELLATGIGAVRGNPRLGLTCASYFVSRGDLAIFVIFFSLWIVAAGTDQGLSVADAQSTAGRLFGVSQTAMLLFIPVMGMICDRFDRVTALAIAMAIATIGYLALGLVGDPFSSKWIYPVAILGGAGEACILVSGPALLGQEAPLKIRGSIIGLVGMCGAVGVLINTKVAGMLFDAWMYQAPFVYMAGFNALICVAAIAVRVYYGKSQAAAPAEPMPEAATADAG